jgi:hypothetical protein
MSPWATSVVCAQTGTYRVDAKDACGDWFEYQPATKEASLYRAGCP